MSCPVSFWGAVSCARAACQRSGHSSRHRDPQGSVFVGLSAEWASRILGQVCDPVKATHAGRALPWLTVLRGTGIHLDLGIGPCGSLEASRSCPSEQV